MTNIYDLCCQHRGKVVTIYDKSGRAHTGRIVNVDRQFVYIERHTERSIGGFGFGFGGLGWGWGWPGAGIIPIALAGIAGFALGSLFWW